jgi:hypothetical protein
VLIFTRRTTALGLVIAALGCGKNAPVTRTDAGAIPDGAGGSSGGDNDAAGVDDRGTPDGGAPDSSAPDVTTTTTACAARGPVTSAPPERATPPAATGPTLWKNVNITAGGFVSGIVFSPAQRDVVYARTDIGGAYRWNATANRWVPLLDWVTRANTNWTGVESIAVDPQDANKVYVAAGTYLTSNNTAILRSNDQGRTFTAATTMIPMGGNADGRSVGERLIVDPNQTDTLYFGSRTMGLWKSSDGAATWSQVTSFPGATTTANGVGIAFVVLDPLSCGPGGQTTLYVALGAAGTPIYRSNDGGATWLALPGQPSALLPSHGAVSSTGHLYVTYGGGTGANGDGPNNVTVGAVYRLDVATGAWIDITPSQPGGAVTFGYSGVSLDGASPDTLVVCTLDRWSVGDEIFRSSDAGATWKPLNVTHAAHDISAAPWVTFHATSPNYTGWMADVEIDPFNPARVLYVTGQGIWATDDMPTIDDTPNTPAPTMHWDFRSAGIEETSVLDLASPPSGAPLLSAVGDIGGFRHDDLDVTPPGGMSSNPVLTNTDSIDFAELAPHIVARVGHVNTTVGAVTISTPLGSLSLDGGTTWAPFAGMPPLALGSAGTIAVSADGATLVWDVPASGRNATPVVAGGPQVSRDHGVTWTPGTGLGAIRPVFADRVNPSKFYAFDSARGRFYVSGDGGATFTLSATATGLPTANNAPRPRATPGIEGDLWVATAMGLRHSTDSGATFAAVGSATAPVALGLGKAGPGASYPSLYLVGTVDQVVGIFRSEDVGVSWTRIDDDQHRWATAVIITGDPRIYGRVYVGTNGRGILYGDIAP